MHLLNPAIGFTSPSLFLKVLTHNVIKFKLLFKNFLLSISCQNADSSVYAHRLIKLRVTVRIKPTNAYENILIYYIIITLNFLHVSVIFCSHLQGDVTFMKVILQRQPSQCTNIPN